MNIAELSIRKNVITWVMTISMVVVGAISFDNLSRLEDPEFTIKEATIMTPYPGASAAEVEKEVTNVIEKAAQELGQLDYVESRSSRGLSIVKVFMKDRYDMSTLPQVWDELRRKVGDYQGKLPPGAGPSLVNDDFGDVYGVYVAISGEGYSYRELYEYAKFLQRDLLGVKDVKRIVLYGEQPEVIYIQMRREKMAELGVSPDDIFTALGAKNLPANAGQLTLGEEMIPINPTGEFTSEQQFGDLLIQKRGSSSQRQVYLRDVAAISRGYREPTEKLLRYDSKPGIGLAISTVSGGNVVTMGDALAERAQTLKTRAPVGMDIDIIALQPDAVSASINGFLINLAEAVVIVVLVLLVFMGLRSGLIIGTVLLVTILGTFIFMAMLDVTLERISLGALVIALGMLVDNAIVVTDGMRVRMKQGEEAIEAAKAVVGQTAIPLLAATLIAIAAFAAIGTSMDKTGEYTRSLFTVILISLSMSWVTAVTSTPLLCKQFLIGKGDKIEKKGSSDPYGGRFFVLYRNFLSRCIRLRWMTIGVVVALFIASMIDFGFVKQSFFPDSTRPQFYIDFWFPEGTHIDQTVQEMERAEKMVLDSDGVRHVTTHIGGGSIRFLLTYTPEYNYPSFGRLLIDVDDYGIIPKLATSLQQELDLAFGDATVNVRIFVNGPATGGKIQLRITGPDPVELRKLGDKALAVLRDEPNAKGIRNEWREMVKVLRPQLAETQARRLGIDRPELAAAMAYMTDAGVPAGIYREDDELLSIQARAPARERADLNNLGSSQIWSPAAEKNTPIDQVITGFETDFENAHLWRRDRTPMLRIHMDQREGYSTGLLNSVKPKIEEALNVDVQGYLNKSLGEDPFTHHTAEIIPLQWNDHIPIKGMPGYYIAWGGENEDSVKAKNSLAGSIPVFFGLMVLIVIWLFNSIRKTLVIWLTVPLAMIGVTVGLLLFNQPFGFMSLLGVMSLAGMLIKNAIVLIDQIDLEIESGKPGFYSIIDSGVSRLIPVSMAALTTILGMLPLVTDAFFVAMAVTIMFGLGFATVLTLVVVPVLYAIFFRIPYSQVPT